MDKIPGGGLIILGIDPGSRVTGYGVIDLVSPLKFSYVCSGCIRTEGEIFVDKLKQIYDGVSEIIVQTGPQQFAIEEPFVSKNVDSSFKLCHARASAILAALNAGLPVGEYSPRKVKQAAAGYGNASKEQIQQMVVRLLKLDRIPQSDAADALAIAICHANTTLGLAGMGNSVTGTARRRMH